MKTSLKITIDVTYDLAEGESLEYVTNAMASALQTITSDGFLSAHHNIYSEVDTYSTFIRPIETISTSRLDVLDASARGFAWEGTFIKIPTLSPCGRFQTSPYKYGFWVEQTGGGCTAWVKECSNGYVVLSNECTHHLGTTGDPFLMGFYDGCEDEGQWGGEIAFYDLKNGINEQS